MRGSWWTWLSAALAIILGLVFGWIAGTGVVQAAEAVGAFAAAVMDVGRPGPGVGDAVGGGVAGR